MDNKFYIPFFGNENAKIITCNINPCKSIKELSLYDILQKNDLTEFDKIYDFLRNFYSAYYVESNIKFNLGFDRKQLMFLAGFSSKVEDCNLKFKGKISESPTKEELKAFSRCEENQQALFSERLQLEFIPFFSNKFKYNKNDYKFYKDCFYNLLEKIKSTKSNKYIILLGKVYEELLDKLVKKGKTGIDNNIKEFTANGNKFKCKIYHIDGYNLLVAPSFQSRYTQSYINGYKYGQFCGENINK